MSTKKTSDAGKRIQSLVEGRAYGRTQFIKFSLDTSSLSAIKAMEFGLDEVNDAVASFCRDGYGFSWKYYEDDGTWGFFLNPKGENHKHAGYTLAGRGSTPIKALRQCVYVHYILFQESWPTDTQPRFVELDD